MQKDTEIITKDIDHILNSKIPFKKIQGKNFLISGANGFLSFYIINTILTLNQKSSKKSKVYALVRNKKTAEKKFKFFLKNKFLKIIEHDLSSEIKISDNIHYVIHAASLASPKFYASDPIGVIMPNVIGTKNLLEFSKRKQVKSFLFFSSGEIYGQTEKLLKETDFGCVNSLDLRSCYAISKLMGENMCLSWFKQKKLPTKIARIFHTYGPRIKLDDGRVYADFVSNVVQNKNLIVKSDGKAKRPFCYITDATIAFFLILLNGENGNAYNVSNPDSNVSILNLAKIISKLFPEKKLKVIVKKDFNEKNYLKSSIKNQNPDISKLRTLNWKPEVSIKEGFRRTILSEL